MRRPVASDADEGAAWFASPAGFGSESRFSFSELTDEMLAEIEWKLNHRPRKSLGYRTPLEYCKQLFNFDFRSVLHF